MKLQHLVSIHAIVKHDLSVTRAAIALNASQPALSMHVQLLEAELRTKLFVRQRNRFVSLSAEGQLLLPIIERAVEAANELQRTARNLNQPRLGVLRVAASQTIARYRLPPLLERFSRSYPKLKIRVQHGTMPQLIEMVVSGEADLALSTRPKVMPSELIGVPCYQLGWLLMTPPDHELLAIRTLGLAELARYPIITYTETFVSHGILLRCFEAEGLLPNFVLLEADSDIIKRYVRSGMGIAIIKDGAFDPAHDAGLAARQLSGILPETAVEVSVRKDVPLSKPTLVFLDLIRRGLASDIRSQLKHSVQ